MKSQCLLSGLLFLAGIATAHGQNGITPHIRDRPAYDGLIAAGSGYLIDNPEMIAGPITTAVSISPDGRFVLVVHHRSAFSLEAVKARLDGTVFRGVKDEVFLSVWDTRSNRTDILWQTTTAPGTFVGLQLQGWFANSSKAMVLLETRSTDDNGKPVETSSFLFVNAANHTIHETVSPDNVYLYPNKSPSQPFALLGSPEGSADTEARFLDADGAFLPPVKLPGFLWFTKWSADGTEIIGGHPYASADPAEGDKWYAINPKTQTIREIPEPPKDSKGAIDFGGEDVSDLEKLPFRLTAKPADGSTTRPSVWLETTDGSEKVLITADGTPLGLTRFAALYSMGGAVYVAPIHEIGAAALARLRQTGIRKAALETAQTINSALVAYVFTHGQLYPDKDANLAKTLNFSAGSKILTDFTYAPPLLRKMTKRNDPKTAVVGFVSVTGGRAILYTDGQVKWEDSP